MSLFAELMIASWTVAIAMIGCCALHQSGKLLRIRKRMELWLETSVTRTPAESLEAESEDAA
jgi:hypothetical protein